jgi:hypothetical protein
MSSELDADTFTIHIAYEKWWNEQEVSKQQSVHYVVRLYSMDDTMMIVELQKEREMSILETQMSLPPMEDSYHEI